MDNYYNFLFIVIFIVIGIYFLFSTYKKPDPLYSTDIKGYLAGIFFILIGLLSLFGRFSIYEVLKEMFNK